MKECHLQLNLAKLLVIPANPSADHNIIVQLGSTPLTPTRISRNLGVVFDDQLNISTHVLTTAQSCRFALDNITKIRSFLSEYTAQLIVLVILRLDYCNALLVGLPTTMTKPLQMIQNAAARLVFNQTKRTHVAPFLVSLHWLPVMARI